MQQGLSETEAARRLTQAGENRLAQKKRGGAAALFFSQFKDVLILILAAAAVVSTAMGQGAEAVAILTIMLLNAVLGFAQEYRTEKTLAALGELSAPVARVRRGGVQKRVNARTVVPGDVLVLRAGDRIPADARLAACVQMRCDEAMLTGESRAVEKKPGGEVYMGCTLQTGHGEAVVTATGMATRMGHIADMMQTQPEEPTPLQLQLRSLGKVIAWLCCGVCFAVALLGYLQTGDFFGMLLTGVSLAVAAIPEGLPAVVTITLALSVGRILRRGAVIRRLHAVETLGCAGVICSDKTGTITQNRMTVQTLETPDGTAAAERDLLESAVLCTTAELSADGGTGDATELALLRCARGRGIEKAQLLQAAAVTGEVPFDAVRKRMSVTVREKDGARLICKGAPDVLLPLCTHIRTGGGMRALTADDRARLRGRLDAMAGAALRVLAVAENTAPAQGEHALCFLGMAGMADPPRPEVAPAVRTCRAAGIKPVMITGDSSATALAVARQVGIARAGDGVVDGAQLDAMTDAQLAAACMRISVYARVSPEHKLRIVRAYKAAGQVCAMTGDGVNDAPAVKAADIGIAMGVSGTDVTREASGVVLLDDNFATIVAAVEEGRVIYQNIRRFIRFLLTSNLGEVLGMLLGMLMGLPVLLSPIQILLVNLFTDGLPAIALGAEPAAGDLMRRPPRPRSEGLFAHGLGFVVAVRGAMLGIASSGAFAAVYALGAPLETARSACFLTIVLSQMLYLFECRGERMHLSGNPALLLAAAASTAGTLLAVYVPLLQQWFGTRPVTGMDLAVVAAASAGGSMLTAVRRAVRRAKGRKAAEV